jgi:predicted transcriptional regulator
MTAAVLDRLLDPVGRSLNGEAARALVAIKADPDVQARVAELAEKCNQGELTPAERSEYETYVAAASVIAVLQAKARARLARSAAP